MVSSQYLSKHLSIALLPLVDIWVENRKGSVGRINIKHLISVKKTILLPFVDRPNGIRKFLDMYHLAVKLAVCSSFCFNFFSSAGSLQQLKKLTSLSTSSWSKWISLNEMGNVSQCAYLRCRYSKTWYKSPECKSFK